MKAFALATVVAGSLIAGLEAAPTDVVTQADLQVLIERIAKLEAENKAQAARIAELESAGKSAETKADEASEICESGKVYTAAGGKRYFLADATANIFEPLSESGLQITPYGYLVVEGVYNTHGAESDFYSDWVKNPHSRGYHQHMSCLSVQDSILGIKFLTPEATKGWTFSGKLEFDLAGDHANDYAFHWRHLFVNAEHESGWSLLFGQTWHLWKMVSPSEFDGSWMENTGHPYRRSPQFRVTKKWAWEDSSLEVRAAIVKNGPGMGGDRDQDSVPDNSASAWPLIEGAIVYDHDTPWDAKGKRWLVGVGGQYGQDRIRNYWGDDRKDDYESMMIMLAAQIPYGDFMLTGQLFAGENLGGVQAGVGQTVAFDPIRAKGREVATVGGFIDLTYQLTADWSFAIGYGFDNPSLKKGYYSVGKDGDFTDNIEFNERAYVDVFYRITENFRLGLEYARLSTRHADMRGVDGLRGGTGSSDRVHFAAFYDF